MTKPYRAAAVLRQADSLPDVVVESVVEFLGKPRARGWIHV
jgi:hemolysin III